MPNPSDAYESITDRYAQAIDDPELRDAIRAMLGRPFAGAKILDVGCGPGHDAAALARSGFAVTAIDQCMGFIEYGRATYQEVCFEYMDLHEPHFEHSSFDGILAMASLIHVRPEELPVVIERYAQLLKPSGRLVIWASDSPIVSFYDVENWGDVADNPVRIWCHQRDRLSDICMDVGLEHIKTTSMHSDYYAGIDRLIVNQVTSYALVASAPDSSSNS